MKEEWYKYPSNLVDMFEDTVKKFPERNFLGVKNSKGDYEWATYRQISERINNLRGGLAVNGIGKGDTIALIIKNSVEWVIVAFATYGLNARLVPMYEQELDSVWKYIIKDSEAKTLFVANEEIFDKIKGYTNEIKTLKKIYIIRSNAKNSMAALEELGKKNPIKSVKPHWSDIASLIYTSGTTGDPKGVLLSHGNFTSNVHGIKAHYPMVNEEDISFSILPWAHSYGQSSELYFDINDGESCALMDTLDTMMTDIQKVRPTKLIAVPRVLNRVYNGIHLKMKAEGPDKEKMLESVKKTAAILREGGKVSPEEEQMCRAVFKQLSMILGGRMRFIFTGSAVVNPEVANFFIDMGITTLDGYGLTETSPTATANNPSACKFGTVGMPLENVTIVIDKCMVGEGSEDGEIVIFGPNVMKGYHNKPEKNKEVFVDDPKRGLGIRTGDRGKIDKDGYLHITGRFKEEYKLENGKYVHPAALEEEIKLNPFIATAMVYGDGKKYNVALIVPDFMMLGIAADKMGISEKSPQALVSNLKIQEFLAAQITAQLEGQYRGYEIPRKFLFIAEDLTHDNGMLTQTLKLKRPIVLKKYGNQLDALYE